MTTYETILVDRTDGIATITLNRPDQRNAMSPALHRDMRDALTDLEFDREVLAVVITGAGESFSAGQDLKKYFYELKDAPAEKEKLQRLSHQWRQEILFHYAKPTIAAVNGYCFGGAFTILGSCDVVVAAEDALFGLSEVNFGHIPGGVVAKVLVDYMPMRQAMYYGMTGETFDGNRAVELGIATLAVPRAEVVSRAVTIAQGLAEKDPLALRATKAAFRDVDLSGISYDEAWRWLTAKATQLRGMQRSGGMGSIETFAAGGGKPGLGVVREAQPTDSGR